MDRSVDLYINYVGEPELTLKIAESVYSRREVARMRQSCKGWRNALQVMLVGEIRRRWPGKREWAQEFAALDEEDQYTYLEELAVQMHGREEVEYLEETVEEEDYGFDPDERWWR